VSRRDGFVDVLTGDGVLRLFDVELQGGTAVPPNQIMTVEATLGVNDMHGLDYIALRYFNVYGPRMDLHGADTEVLVRWMEAIAHGRPPVIFGDGQQRMDFVNVDASHVRTCSRRRRRSPTSRSTLAAALKHRSLSSRACC
jgi:NAD dependent epimerase/dehydratase family